MNNAWPLVSAALLMGAGGSLHCMAMCAGLQRMTLRGIPVVTQKGTGDEQKMAVSSPAASVAAAAVSASALASAPPSPTTTVGHAATSIRLPDARWWRFQGGRVFGYGLLGAATGLFGQQLLAAASWQPVFESLWAGLNGLLILLGLSLLVLGREPRWLAAAGARLAGSLTPARWRHTEWLRGMLWAFLPCGLLYTALATAILAATPLGAAAVMAAFAVGTSVGLFLVEAGMHTLLVGSKKPQLAYRLNGLFLLLLSGAALAAALMGMDHPFC
ncbi:MAG: sulfite exporter TauE/SafE family protein [Lautropia sp.]|nr:sulfite exporter TauE/SafE family protein [Lautropia sp.]